MKELLVALLFINIILFSQADPLKALIEDDDTPGKIHSLYQTHYSSYKAYLKSFNKKKDLLVPEPARLMKYAENVKMVQEHNERYEKGLETYKMGLNEMSDWTEEEKEQLHGHNPKLINMKANVTDRFSRKHKKLPRSIDYRKKGVLAPIKNQGRCGVCYIFSAIAAVEAYTAMRTSHPVVPLSEQHVMDCSGLQKCNGYGGSGDSVWEWIAKTDGVMSNKDYPYLTANGAACPNTRNKPLAKVFGSARLPDNEALKQALLTYGPVSIGVHASLASFRNYKSGIYNDPKCPSEAKYINHEILAVGYGQEDGQEYFIVRNSWGTTWGEEGYARIIANKYMCGLGHDNLIPLV